MQDWKPVIINGGKVKNKKTLETKNKQKHTESSKKNKKLDDANEAKKIEKVPKEIARKIIDARVAKKWKQKELAAKMSIPVKMISDIETCKANYNKKFIQKIARKLGIFLEKK
jgi:ribosome-binding protein aMBF1 (putative translation factor)|tara:strand:+ start:346 stop:684 length:339 start_codon:yes stop_codon:yes gene_type:complete